MKQKNKSEELVTKSFLENKLVELKKEILVKVDENARNYRDQILTKLDGVMGELQTMREENTVGTYQISELREKVDNHDKRIASLEKIQPST